MTESLGDYHRRQSLLRSHPPVGDIVDEMDRLYEVDRQIEELTEESQARRLRIYEDLKPRRVDRASLLSRSIDHGVYAITFPEPHNIDYVFDLLVGGGDG